MEHEIIELIQEKTKKWYLELKNRGEGVYCLHEDKGQVKSHVS